MGKLGTVEVITFDPEGEHAWVKVGNIPDLTEPGMIGAKFNDAIDPQIEFMISNIGEKDVEDPDKVFADLTITDRDFDAQTTWRVRVSKRLHEASDFTWEFVDEHKRVITIIGGIATGAFIGVMTLYKIRQKFSSED